MAIIPQKSLFLWDEIENLEDLERLRLVIEYMPDEGLMRKLEKERGKGRDDYPVRAMWNSVLAGVVFQHISVESLRRELSRNGQLRYMCGFQPLETRGGNREVSREIVPPPWVYTRFLKKLIDNKEEIDRMFEELVEELSELLPGFGKDLSIDSKAINSLANGKNKNTEEDGRRDTDADWGRKTYSGVRKDGTMWEKVVSWFGYKLHLIVDSNYELPVAYGLTKASEQDINEAHRMVEKLFLRISEISELNRKKAEYEIMERMYEIGVPIPKLLEFGLCDDGKKVYSLFEWIDGKDVESVLPLMSETEQYVLGIKAGETLRKIHSLSVSENTVHWQERYFSIIDERIEAYHSEGIPFEGNKTILEYYNRNRSLLYNRPQCLLHGDFHEGNLMISDDGKLYIIDLLDEGFGNYGDPWYDFKTFGENGNAYFSTGLIHGYFNGEPAQEFWDVLTYYIVTAAITSIVWMKYNKPDELPETLSWNEKNARFLRDGHSPLMKWYLSDFYIQYTDDVPYKLKAPFDFSFLSKYGKVFKVFDDQDSGNICFGVANDDNRYFIKFAGAPTERACVTVDDRFEKPGNTKVL